jgi:hypothetical protein
MEADPERGQAACPLDRIIGGALADHQAGARQDPLAMGALDRLVDGDVEAEIVRREDDALQCAT